MTTGKIEHRCFSPSIEETLSLPVTKEASREEAEVEFVCRHGLPEAVLSPSFNTIVKMFDGTSWYRSVTSRAYSPLSLGDSIKLISEATHVDRGLSEFAMISDSSGNPSKKTGLGSVMLEAKLRMPGVAATAYFASSMVKERVASGPANVFFAGATYCKANVASSIAYAGNSPVKALLLSQGTNECTSAAILNANMWQGKLDSCDKEFLAKMHDKVAHMVGNSNRTVNIFRLIKALDRGQVPGMKLENVSSNYNMKDDLVFALRINYSLMMGYPVVAVVPSYGGHAIALIENMDGRYYRTIDTISGEEQYFAVNEMGLIFSPVITDREKFVKWVESGK